MKNIFRNCIHNCVRTNDGEFAGIRGRVSSLEEAVRGVEGHTGVVALVTPLQGGYGDLKEVLGAGLGAQSKQHRNSKMEVQEWCKILED